MNPVAPAPRSQPWLSPDSRGIAAVLEFLELLGLYVKKFAGDG
jgi:hypothetical protein